MRKSTVGCLLALASVAFTFGCTQGIQISTNDAGEWNCRRRQSKAQSGAQGS